MFQDSTKMMIQDASTPPSVAETSPYVLASNGDSTNSNLPSSLKASQLDKGSSEAKPMVRSYKSDILQSQWESMFHNLLEYKALHGNCLVPHRYRGNPALGGKWRFKRCGRPFRIDDFS